jgi:hypothetical protein
MAMPIVLPHLPPPSAWFSHGPSTRPVAHRRRVGHWTLEVTSDPFTGAIGCRLHGRGMMLERGVMTFDFGADAHTFEAVYRIDQGPATPWRVNAMALAAAGASLQTDSLKNPSGGKVLTPLGPLIGARKITIRPSPTAEARTFTLADLGPALHAASAAGCGPDFPDDSAK